MHLIIQNKNVGFGEIFLCVCINKMGSWFTTSPSEHEDNTNEITQMNVHNCFPIISYQDKKRNKKEGDFIFQFCNSSENTFLTYLLTVPLLFCPLSHSPGSISATSQYRNYMVGKYLQYSLRPQHHSSGFPSSRSGSPCLVPALQPPPWHTPPARVQLAAQLQWTGSGSRSRLIKSLLLSLFCRVIFNLDQSQIQFTLLSHK